MMRSLFFRYKVGSSILHKMPTFAKLILTFFISALAFFLPIFATGTIFLLSIFCSIFVLRLSKEELFSDLKPSIAYAILLFLATLILNLIEFFSSNVDFSQFSLRFEYLSLALSTAAALQTTSLLYRSTSILQIKETFEKIEFFITKKERCTISETISLSLSFLPEVASIWVQLENAYFARGGKNGIQKLFFLSPKLLKISMKKAFQKSLALEHICLENDATIVEKNDV